MDTQNFLWPGRRSCKEENITLKINECCLDVFSNFSSSLKFFTRNSQCQECNFTSEKSFIKSNHTTSFILNTDYPIEFFLENVKDDSKSKLCSNMYSFHDLGKYAWNVSEHSCGSIEIVDPPESFLLNLGVLFSVCLGILFAYGLHQIVLTTKNMFKVRRDVSFHELEADLGNPNTNEESNSFAQSRLRRQSRIASVDVFRGLAIALMIFCNYGGGGYKIFQHSPWNGITVADIVFPWFVWIMGVSIALSLRSHLRASVSRRRIFGRIYKRSMLLIALGLILNSGKNSGGATSFETLRIPGVLQRIGVTYFIVASIELIFIKPQRNERFGPWYFCPDVVDAYIQWILAIVVVAVHESITFLLPVPGCPTGYLGPGGWHEHSKYENCTGGAAGYIDRIVFSDNHLYKHPTFEKIYHTHQPFDPEGLLGTLTCIFCAFLGLHAGRIILCYENTSSRILRWQIWAVILGIIAVCLCNSSENDGIIPLNKNLWSLSYVLATSSMAFWVFSILYWLIDYKRFCKCTPLLYTGMNAITLYIGHEVMKKFLPWYWKPFTQTHGELLAMNLIATVIWLAISYVLYKKNIFISL